MTAVNTVLGPVDSADLGFTLSHEHITLGAAGTAAIWPNDTASANGGNQHDL